MTTIDAPLTVTAFLRHVREWVYVQSDRDGTVYIWPGREHSHDAGAILLAPSTGHIVEYPAEGENDLAVVTDDHGNPKHVDEGSRRLLVTLLTSESRIRDERSWRAMVEADWRVLQEKLTHYAIDKHWCVDYDRLILGWNDDLTVLKLLPRRTETYEVSAEITATWRVSIKVQDAEDTELARQRVLDMPWGEISNLDEVHDRPPNARHITVTGVEAVALEPIPPHGSRA